MLRYPDDIYPLLKMKRAIEKAEKQIPPEPHWGFCYSMLHKVSRSFSLVIQQLNTELRNAVSSSRSRSLCWSTSSIFGGIQISDTHLLLTSAMIGFFCRIRWL